MRQWWMLHSFESNGQSSGHSGITYAGTVTAQEEAYSTQWVRSRSAQWIRQQSKTQIWSKTQLKSELDLAIKTGSKN